MVYIKGHLELLHKMQRKAALWITGAFHTTPGGVAESLGGLSPIHLLIQRLVDRGYLRANTLMPSHPTLGLVNRPYVGETHPSSLRSIPAPARYLVKSPVMDISLHMSELSEEFSAVDAERSPGSRLLDQFPDRVSFDLKVLSSDEDSANQLRMADGIIGMCNGANGDRMAAVCCDGSLPTGRFQAVAAFGVLRNGDWTAREIVSLGRASALDAELIAIELGIKAALLDAPPDLKQLVVFSDSVKAICLAADPSIHSSQQKSLNIASRLHAWFGYGDDRKILFVHVSQRLCFL